MLMTFRNIARGSLAVLISAALLSACGGGGGGSGSTTPPVQTYKLSGTVSGIASGNQVSLSNGSDTITVTSNGSFTFDQGVAAGAAYNVSVNAPSQPCIALFANGTMTSAGVSTLQVQCGPQEQKTFHASGAINATRVSPTMFALSDGSAVIVGGTTVDGSGTVLPFEHYNPATQTWTAYSVAPPSTSISASALLENGTILISTGATTQVFDPVAGTLSAANPFASITYASILLPLQDGRVMASDGQKIEFLSTSSGTWSTGPAAANTHSSFVLLGSGKVLASGGVLPIPTANSEMFDPVAGTWTAVAAMNTARASHTAILMPSGKVLAVGGIAGQTISYCGCGFYPVAAAELFDPATGLWTAAGTLTTAREGATATLMPTGKVLVVGGNLASQFGAGANGPMYSIPTTQSSTEIYDPVANSWSAWGSLINARTLHAATLLSSGELLVAGGYVSVAGSDPSVTENWTNQPVAVSELAW